MKEEKIINHESYGLLGITRYTGGHDVMFGSSIKHRNGISIRLYQAEHRRDLSRDWYFGRDLLFEVNMSQAQFAEMITTPNVGSGVPCTIQHVMGKTMEKPPFEAKAQTFRDEFAQKVAKIADDGTLYMKDALDILKNKPTLGKGDRQVILDAFAMLQQEIKSNIPFLQKQFHEQMDKTIVEAKSEIEAFVEHKIRTVGLESIRDQTPQLMENSGV